MGGDEEFAGERGFGGTAAKGFFGDLLDGPTVRLSLPAGEVGAVVGDQELDIPHEGWVRPPPGRA